MKLLERVQRSWTRSIRNLENIPYEDRLQRLNLFSVQGRLQRADLIMVWRVFQGDCAINPSQLFSMNVNPTRGHPFKIYKPRFNLDIRKRGFAVRVVDDSKEMDNRR